MPIAAVVEVAGARVRITATERADAAVLVEPIDPTSRKDVKVAEKTKVDVTAGQLSVRTTTSGDKHGSVAITIELPVGSSLTAYLAYSELSAVGRLGDCQLHMASGRVELDRVDALRASLASGEVTVGGIAGPATIDGGAFALRIGEVTGPVGLSNSGGRTWIGHAAADVELSSASCDFDIDRADGRVTAETASGAIRIGRMSRGQARLRNASGAIEVGVGAGTVVSVDAHSERGAVHDFASAQPGTEKLMVYARTRHGDIIIDRVA